MRTAILVLGMHRSGTSALTGVLTMAGATAPASPLEPNFANERGYYESLPFMMLHDEMLAALDSNWRDWRRIPAEKLGAVQARFGSRALRLLDEEFGDAPLLALKDPRMCRFAPFWLAALRDAGVAARAVIPFRAPDEVAASHAQRDGMPVEEGLLLWLRHVLDAERDTRGLRRAFVSMDDLLADWRSALARIGRQIAVDWPAIDEIAIDSFLAPELKHHSHRNHDLAGRWASRGYDALKILAGDPDAALAQDALDGLAREFDAAGALFGPLVVAPWAAPPQVEPAVPAQEPPDARLEARRSSAALRKKLDRLRAEAAGGASLRTTRPSGARASQRAADPHLSLVISRAAIYQAPDWGSGSDDVE